jgi:cell division protein FtsB
VDLYAYTSMVVATVQQQAARLDRQQRELETLRAEVARLTRQASRPAR